MAEAPPPKYCLVLTSFHSNQRVTKATELGSTAEKGPRAYLSSKAHRKPREGWTEEDGDLGSPRRLPAPPQPSQALLLPFRDLPPARLASEANSSALLRVAASGRTGPWAAGPVQPP